MKLTLEILADRDTAHIEPMANVQDAVAALLQYRSAGFDYVGISVDGIPVLLSDTPHHVTEYLANVRYTDRMEQSFREWNEPCEEEKPAAYWTLKSAGLSDQQINKVLTALSK